MESVLTVKTYWKRHTTFCTLIKPNILLGILNAYTFIKFEPYKDFFFIRNIKFINQLVITK